MNAAPKQKCAIKSRSKQIVSDYVLTHDLPGCPREVKKVVFFFLGGGGGGRGRGRIKTSTIFFRQRKSKLKRTVEKARTQMYSSLLKA